MRIVAKLFFYKRKYFILNVRSYTQRCAAKKNDTLGGGGEGRNIDIPYTAKQRKLWSGIFRSESVKIIVG